MVTYQEWLEAQKDEHPQPFKNQAATFTYIPRKDGDLLPASWANHLVAQTTTPTTPYYYTVPSPAPNFNQVDLHSPLPQYPSYSHVAYSQGHYAPPPVSYTSQVPAYYPSYPSYGYYAYPTAALPSTNPYGVGHDGRLSNGTYPWYGRTASEVERDNMRLAQEQARKEGGHKMKPIAAPGDMFWVWEPNHKDKNMYSFATIERNFKGTWTWDPYNGFPYFTRNKDD